MEYSVLIHKVEEGGFWSEVPALPGCFSQGETVEETIANTKEAAELILSVLKEDNRETPVEDEFTVHRIRVSGDYTKDRKQRLTTISMKSVGRPTDAGTGMKLMVDAKVLEAVNFFSAIVTKNGIHIHDLILFGSSGRGTITPDSDIDIAVISTDFAGKDIFERAFLTKDAEIQTVRKFRVALDVLTLTPEEYRDPASLIAGAIRKGIVVPTGSSA